MKKLALLALSLVGFAYGCGKKQVEEAPRDYEGARQRSASDHQDLDRQSR